ncbi:hypothetical protein F4820DRAFT_415299 [Hypoxylon rubiginosum]|uniref:Uncharacterized protein n=1 Tax=Hypoxylon rubiginosum TaxID=110542 RepID=A0ACB9Z693_9PEZI|nr:hypothetical protein F4820DRAFT_415299 [Hypoxylon rubiginosum]
MYSVKTVLMSIILAIGLAQAAPLIQSKISPNPFLRLIPNNGKIGSRPSRAATSRTAICRSAVRPTTPTTLPLRVSKLTHASKPNSSSSRLRHSCDWIGGGY